MKTQSLSIFTHDEFAFLFASILALTLYPNFSVAQSLTSGDVAGTVLDPTGAAFPARPRPSPISTPAPRKRPPLPPPALTASHC